MRFCYFALLIYVVFVMLIGVIHRYGTRLGKRDFRALELHFIEELIAVFWFMMLML